MATEGKYGRITTERKDLPADEPVFLLRGQDPHTPRTIRRHAQECQAYGADAAFVQELFNRAEEIKAWQTANPDRVKKNPD